MTAQLYPYQPMTPTHERAHLHMMLIVKKALEYGFARINVQQMFQYEGHYVEGWQIMLHPNRERDTAPGDTSQRVWIELYTNSHIHPIDSNVENTLENIVEWIASQRPIHRAIYDDQMLTFFQALRLGWSVSRTVNHEPEFSEIPEHHGYQFSASNVFYNTEGHPEHRDNGTEVSVNWSLGFMPERPASRLWIMRDAEHSTQEELTKAITNRAPWYQGTIDPFEPED